MLSRIFSTQCHGSTEGWAAHCWRGYDAQKWPAYSGRAVRMSIMAWCQRPKLTHQQTVIQAISRYRGQSTVRWSGLQDWPWEDDFWISLQTVNWAITNRMTTFLFHICRCLFDIFVNAWCDTQQCGKHHHLHQFWLLMGVSHRVRLTIMDDRLHLVVSAGQVQMGNGVRWNIIIWPDNNCIWGEGSSMIGRVFWLSRYIVKIMNIGVFRSRWVWRCLIK